ncbi:hypothetical protein ABKN59_004742 [Abortiporus biennis]
MVDGSPALRYSTTDNHHGDSPEEKRRAVHTAIWSAGRQFQRIIHINYYVVGISSRDREDMAASSSGVSLQRYVYL